MKNKKLISIIIPIYNGEKYISDTIDSVLNQTYTQWELIIIDNCSTDGGGEIVKNYQEEHKEIRYIKLDYNSGGPARPRNVGIDNAKGEYVAFLDADDIWLEDKLERQVLFLEKNQVKFTSCSCKLIDEKNTEVQISLLSRIYSNFVKRRTLCDMIKNNFIITSSVLVEKNLLKKFNEEKNYIAVEDFDLWLQIWIENDNKYKYQNDKLIQYRLLKNSASNRKSILNQQLKANLVLSNFVLKYEEYLPCYIYNQFFHLVVKKIKSMIMR